MAAESCGKEHDTVSNSSIYHSSNGEIWVILPKTFLSWKKFRFGSSGSIRFPLQQPIFHNKLKGVVKHFRMKINDMKRERRFDDSMLCLSSLQYMIELNKCKIATIFVIYVYSILSCISNLIIMTWSHRNVVPFSYR